ncbi:MAG: hypothetical protein KZQ94_10395 [Candidatus Thiodiazotropha sp. (ex Troendleina suluensis)]|nr:hypothetical protein [Candidatus Thiodiazotropha sp. (ex Troendleina suluensis)]
MRLFVVKVVVAFCAALMAILPGCSGERYARATDYDADGGMMFPATVGGCKIATSEDKMTGDVVLSYEGPDGKCQIEYSSE